MGASRASTADSSGINGYPRITKVEQERDTLVNIEPLRKTVECALISSYIKNEKPLSLLIVAKAESGKTSIMKQYRQNEGVAYVSDCTAYGLTRDILPKMVSSEIRTLMIPDLITPLSKSHKTRQGFIAFLNNLIEEGIVKITSYATIWDKEVKANLITAITDEALQDGRHDWAKMGFLSRLIVFSYSYSISTIVKILSYYSGHGLFFKNAKFKMPRKEADIELSAEIADKLDPIAMKIGEQFEVYGIRAKINFRSLLKSLAVRNQKKIVTDKEFQEFLELADYMNFDYNPV
jgi:hypothetical protein